MIEADVLLLDAKQTLLDEQHRRFEALRQAGRFPEAMLQFQATVVCATDLLSESLTLLQRVLESHRTQDACRLDASTDEA